MSSSVHTNNKNKDILVLLKGQKQELDITTPTAETEYSINFQDHKENFVFIIMEAIAFYWCKNISVQSKRF